MEDNMPVDISKIAAETHSDEIPVTSQYDSLWGYYTFSQTVQYEYDDIGKSGLSYATITINGFFTKNSEYEGESTTDTDSDKHQKLLKKYNTLRGKLLACVGKTAPKNVGDIGTNNDARCTALPSKLKNNKNEIIYAIPTSFALTESSPEILRYIVTLVEPKKIPCKLAIGNDIIDNASLTIICRRPRVTYRSFAFADGAEAYVTGIDNRKYTLSGTINGSESDLSYKDFIHVEDGDSDGDEDGSNSNSTGMSSSSVNVISGIINKTGGKVVVGIQKTSDSKPKDAFAMMLTSHNVGYVFDNGVVSIDISGEECELSNSSSANG